MSLEKKPRFSSCVSARGFNGYTRPKYQNRRIYNTEKIGAHVLLKLKGEIIRLLKDIYKSMYPSTRRRSLASIFLSVFISISFYFIPHSAVHFSRPINSCPLTPSLERRSIKTCKKQSRQPENPLEKYARGFWHSKVETVFYRYRQYRPQKLRPPLDFTLTLVGSATRHIADFFILFVFPASQ